MKNKLLQADVANPKTKHGALQLPVTDLRGFSGKKAGGIMRSKKDIHKEQMDMAPFAKGGSIKPPGFSVSANAFGTNNTEGERGVSKVTGKNVERAVGFPPKNTDSKRKFASGGIAEDKKELSEMKKKGAPASIVKGEQKEIAWKKKGFAKGGVLGNTGYVGKGVLENTPSSGNNTAGENPKVQKHGFTEGRTIKMARGGGIEAKGKTRGRYC